MSLLPTGPGKSAPKINTDFIAFDPLKSTKPNVLLDPPPQQGDAGFSNPYNSCKHEYTTKASQSILPPLDARPDGNARHKVAITCKKCRLHADLELDYQHCTEPCPNSECPLHHFQRLPDLDDEQHTHLKYVWQCSSSACGALLNITFKAQRMVSEDVVTLTDTNLLKRRYEDVQRYDPEREGFRQATPQESLTRLRKYIKDALNLQHTRRVFPANNKRFMEAFGYYGRDCRLLLESYGFSYSESEATWSLPNPPPIDDRSSCDGSTQREFLEDVEMELLALTTHHDTGNAEGWPSANRDIERTLAAQGYPRYVSLRRGQPLSELDQYFASLGALPDFADNLIEFLYDRQSTCDPENQPYYFECLEAIAAARSSENLQVKTTMLESQGSVSRRNLNEAYGFFGLPRGGGGADDDRIMNLYQAQQADLGPSGLEKSREMLFRIGNIRGSKLLMNAAQQSIETQEEALAWLGNGVDKNTTDDMLITVFALRTDSDPGKEEIGRKAISVIATARQSNQLHTWLETGRTDGYTMSIDEALRHLNIEQSFDSVDGSIWPQIFESARSDRPGPQTERAITAVQQALVGGGSSRSPSDWPVGLTSHGNTCYLNSLLQYYFSIKPLRDIVLDYENYSFDTSKSLEKKERVGQRQISLLEIKGGQKFAEDLGHLFDRMIKDPSSAVKPEQDLVCRAFLDPKDSDLWDTKGKQSTENAIDDSKTEGEIVASPTTEQVEELLPTQADVPPPSDTAKDVNMVDSNIPPTPPASPGQKPRDDAPAGPPPLPPRRFSTTTNAALERAQLNATQQQDVTEVHDGIQFRLRAGMKPSGRDVSGEQIDELLKLFSISLVDTPIKDGVSFKPQELTDSAIQLNVPNGPTDIYSALDAVFDQQIVEGTHRLERYKSIAKLPPFLQINIPRVGFDKLKGEQFKSEHSIRLEDELFLDRYFVGATDDILQRRRSAWGWRKRLADLQKEQVSIKESACGVDGPTAVAETGKYISQLEGVNEDFMALGAEPIAYDSDLPSLLANTAVQQAQRLVDLESEIKTIEADLDRQFGDLKRIKYRLQAVFFHRGKTAHGHYWICIRDFSNDMWRKYNDERVEELPTSKLNELYQANDWSHGTPTYAVYVRSDLKDDYVQPVCRHLEKPASPGQSPTDDELEDVDLQTSGLAGLQRDVAEPDAASTGNTVQMVQEGGKETWDPERDVADVRW